MHNALGAYFLLLFFFNKRGGGGARPQALVLNPLDGDVQVVSVKGPPYMAFHYINAWESDDGKTVTMTVPTFKDPEMVNGLLLDRMRSDAGSVEPSKIQ